MSSVKHPDIGMPQQHVADRPQFLGAVSGAGRVAWIVQHEPLGLRRDRRFQVLGAQLEAVVLRARHQHRLAVGQRDDVGITDPARAGDDHLIAGVQRRQHGVEDHLLAAGGDDDLLRLVVDAGVALELLPPPRGAARGCRRRRCSCVSPASMARIAASLMLRGVSKSGSPCDRLITFFPSAIIFRATVEMAMVRLGWIRSRRSAVRCMADSQDRRARPYRSELARAIVAAAEPRCARHTTSRNAATAATMTVASA